MPHPAGAEQPFAMRPATRLELIDLEEFRPVLYAFLRSSGVT
jgi:hypothetical protein